MSVAKQTPGRVAFRKVYTLPLWWWDISLTLNMTYFFICLCEGSEATKQSPGMVVVYGVYAAYFFEGIATLTLAMTRKFGQIATLTLAKTVFFIVIAREHSDRGNPSE